MDFLHFQYFRESTVSYECSTIGLKYSIVFLVLLVQTERHWIIGWCCSSCCKVLTYNSFLAFLGCLCLPVSILYTYTDTLYFLGVLTPVKVGGPILLLVTDWLCIIRHEKCQFTTERLISTFSVCNTMEHGTRKRRYTWRRGSRHWKMSYIFYMD